MHEGSTIAVPQLAQYTPPGAPPPGDNPFAPPGAGTPFAPQGPGPGGGGGGGWGPPGGYYPGGPPGFGPGGAQDTHPLAIAALVGGILSIVPGCCCMGYSIALPIAAIVCAVMGMGKITADPMRYKGRGLAIAGIACAAVALLCDVIALFSTYDEELRRQIFGH